MNQISLIFALILYLILLITVAFFQRKDLAEHYQEVFKAIGLTLIIPFCFVIYAELFPAKLDDNSLLGFIWFPGILILQAIVYCYCLYVYKRLRPFIATLFIGEIVPFLYIYFIYSMMVTGEWI